MTLKEIIMKRDRIGLVLWGIYLVLLVSSVAIFISIVKIQTSYECDPVLKKHFVPSNKRTVLEPERGNILDCHGRILALSCPSYQLYMDCSVRKKWNRERFSADSAARLEQIWLDKARELSKELAGIFPGTSAEQFYRTIREGRIHNRKYVKIGKRIDWSTYQKVLTFPLFREGRFYSGLVAEQESIRKYPYGTLARRTIGFVRNNKSNVENSHIGIEGKFDYVLHGTDGVEHIRQTDFGSVRNNDSLYVRAIAGLDVRTTLNIDYQEIAERALRSELKEAEEVQGACLVLMEVKSGAIRAMVNLSRMGRHQGLDEYQNIAIGRKGEPGSVFKTVTLLSSLSDGYIRSLEETMPTNGGVFPIKRPLDEHIVEYERDHHTRRISYLDGFKMSSNYVFGTMAHNFYGKNPKKFIGNIYAYKLGDKFDFDIDGLATPTIPSPDSRYWSPNDLISIGFGYTTGETPLHILTFYNAIAGKGRMMKPYLVEDFEENGVVRTRRGQSVLNASICPASVADTVTRALKAVTEDGTAKWAFKGMDCTTVAGKTGTSFEVLPGGGYYDKEGRRKYQGTFVGFFPADRPVYSFICYIHTGLTRKQYQGGGIPARAIRKVIDEIYPIDPQLRAR